MELAVWGTNMKIQVCVYVCVHVYISAPQIQSIEVCHSSLTELDVPQRRSNKVRPIQQQFSKALFKPLGV